MLSQGCAVESVLERTGFRSVPASIQKYLFCSPSMDFKFRCMPSAGGLYDQRYRDYIDFLIIEARLRLIKKRIG